MTPIISQCEDSQVSEDSQVTTGIVSLFISCTKIRVEVAHFYQFCPNLLDGGIHKDRASAKQSLFAWTLSSTLRSRNSCSMAEFRVECLTYAHSRARPVPSLTSPGYDLPPTVTIPARRLINIKRRRASNPGPVYSGHVVSPHGVQRSTN